MLKVPHVHLSGALVALISVIAIGSVVRAQVSSGGGGGAAPPSVYTGRPDIFGKAGRGEEGLPIGGWLVFPTAFAGTTFATNPSQSSTGARAAAGLRLTTNTYAQNDDGVKKIILYTRSNFDIYSNQGTNTSAGNDLSTHSGVIGTYQPLSDVAFNLQADFTRQQNFFSASGIANNLSTLNPTGVGIAPTSNPLSYNQLSGSMSLQKSFTDAFIIVSGSIVDITYDSSSTNTAPSPNGTTLTGTARVGYWVTPDVYGYAEGSIDTRDYATTGLSSSGYRTLVGLGSDRIGLFRGELYAGYQAENAVSAAVGTTSSPVFGGKISYFPLPELTINTSINETIGASLLTATPNSPSGTSTEVTDILGQVNYALAPEWTATGRGGVAITTYGGTSRRDTAWTAGMSVNYSVWRSFGINFDYQHNAVISNAPQTAFTNDVLSVGLSYRY